MASLLLIISIFACTSEPSPKELILEKLKEEPHKAKELAEQIEDPIERTKIITEIVENYPHRTRILCEALPSAISKERCFRINQRPHLWKEQRDHLKINPKALSPLTEDCTLDPNINTCRTAQALDFLEDNDIESAFQTCASITENRWQAECFFTISEDLAEKPETYAKAISACDYAKQFAKPCWHHSVMGLAGQTPQHWNDWEWHNKIIALIDQVWIDRDQEFKADLHSHFWAQSLRRHIEKGVLNWNLLPPVAIPHAHSAKAMQLMRKADMKIAVMNDWLKLKDVETYPTRTKARGFDSEIDLWKDEPTPQDCQVISYLGNSHRFSCTDANVDWQIAFLEASARLRPSNLGLIGSLLQAKHPAVQQTALRLKSMDLQAAPDQQMGR
jgi:hypothetical protein